MCGQRAVLALGSQGLAVARVRVGQPWALLELVELAKTESSGALCHACAVALAAASSSTSPARVQDANPATQRPAAVARLPAGATGSLQPDTQTPTPADLYLQYTPGYATVPVELRRRRRATRPHETRRDKNKNKT